MSSEKSDWGAYYKLRDGSITDKRSQRAYDAQKRGRFPLNDAIGYITRALKVTPEEAEKILIREQRG